MNPRHARPWSLQDASLLALLVGVAVWAASAPLADIVRTGLRDAEQSHVLLAPLVIAWLAWVRRSRLDMIKVRPSLLGPAVVTTGLLSIWWAARADVFLAWHGGALMVVLGMVLSFTGFELLRRFGPCVAALAFAVPVPGTIRQALSGPLQSIASTVTHSCLETLSVQATQLGNVLVVNGRHVAVAEACNGLRLVFALTLVVYAFAFSSPLRPSTRMALILAGPLVAVAANVVRLIPTSLMFTGASPERAMAVHDLLGWLMLPVVLGVMAVALRVCRWLDVPVTPYRLAYP